MIKNTLLTPKQELLIKIAQAQGHIKLEDARFVYTSKTARKQALKKLVALQYLQISNVPDRFDIKKTIPQKKPAESVYCPLCKKWYDDTQELRSCPECEE